MSIKASTGYSELILGPNSFEGIFDGGCIRVFSGSRPANADAAETGVLLGQFTNQGGSWTPTHTVYGLHFERTGKYVVNPATELWKMRASTTGIAAWFRLVARGDSGDVTYTEARIDGDIGLVGVDAELQLPSVNIQSGVTYPLDAFILTIPPI